MPESAEVDAWFHELDHPLKRAMLEVRKIILNTDRRLTETIQVEEPHLRLRRQHGQHRPAVEEARPSLMFHQGASLPGKHPKLEGGGGTVRYMRFADLGDVRAKREDLQGAVRAWCALKAGRGLADPVL